MRSNSEITFCILSYNRPDYLKRCIDSCLLYAEDSKIIILDNSDDDSSIKKLQQEYSDSIDWYYSEETLGYAKNFLRAFDICKSQYLVALHDDDRIRKGFCEKQLNILKKSKNASAISCNGYFINNKNEKISALMTIKNNNNRLKTFASKDEYIKHKYSILGKCIPFSPMMFDLNKAMFLKDLILQRNEKFGAAIDAILITDLLSSSDVILNYDPLYECGDHIGQDSKVYDNYWETQFMTYLLNDNSVGYVARNAIMRFYMTDLLINWLKSVFNKELLIKFEIKKEILSIKAIPSVIFAILYRLVIKLKI